MLPATQTLPSASENQDQVQGYLATVINGPDDGLQVDSNADRFTVGTHPSNTLVLSDSMVSRFHCEIILDAGMAQVADLGSKNGTLLDGVRVFKACVRDGSLLSLGRTTLRVRLGAAATRRLSQSHEFGGLVGRSLAMRALFDVLECAAPTDATILLQGETGTGKGITAESIHDTSQRRNKPFTVVDCAAIPSNLLESELFGHERGAFTGALSRHVGAFEAADGGTLFLDEIGELPLDLQPKLLRALEERQVRRVGSTSVQRVDVRVIAATNRDLRKEVNEGRFRSDLYYRLALIHVRVPALREHPEDIPLLVERILDHSRHASSDIVAMLRAPDFIGSLQRALWPGNVRELRNHIERCLVMRQRLPLDGPATDSPPPSSGSYTDPRMGYHEARLKSQLHWEAEYLHALIDHHQGRVDDAARAAGVSRAYLYRLLGRHGIRRSF